MSFSVRRFALVLVCTVGLVGGVGQSAAWAKPRPPHCNRHGVCKPGANFKWEGPDFVVGLAPNQFTSITPCPMTRPDGSPLLGESQVDLFIGFYVKRHLVGGVGNSFATNADGSWSVNWEVPVDTDIQFPKSKAFAACVDTGDFTTTANYKALKVKVNP